MRKFLILSVFMWNVAVFAQKTDSASIRTTADIMPYFAGCEHLRDDHPQRRTCSNKAITDYISAKLIYPDSAIAHGISGMVIASFVLDEIGNIQSVRIERDIGGDCGKEALRIIKNMPRWEPAFHQNKPVKIRLTLPIRFAYKTQTGNEADQYSIHWNGLEYLAISKTMLLKSLDETILIRDAYGRKMEILALSFILHKGKKQSSATCVGEEPDKDLRKIAEKAESGNEFTVTATILHGDNKLDVSRTYVIEDDK